MSLQCSLKLGCPFRPLSPLLCACTGCRAKDSRDSNELATEYTVCNPSSGFLGSSWAVEAQEAQWPVSWLATARKCLNSSCSSQSLHTPSAVVRTHSSYKYCSPLVPGLWSCILLASTPSAASALLCPSLLETPPPSVSLLSMHLKLRPPSPDVGMCSVWTERCWASLPSRPLIPNLSLDACPVLYASVASVCPVSDLSETWALFS